MLTFAPKLVNNRSCYMHRLLRILFVLAVTSPLIVNANTHADEGHGGGPETELTPEKQREKNNEFVNFKTKVLNSNKKSKLYNNIVVLSAV